MLESRFLRSDSSVARPAVERPFDGPEASRRAVSEIESNA
jgi:hypothetical protein